MHTADRTHVGIAGIGPPDACRIGHHRLQLCAQRSFRLAQQDGVVVRLRHLAAIGAGEFGRGCQQRPGLGKYHLAPRITIAGMHLARIELVKPPRHLACQLHVRHLVLAHRHKIRLVNQDIGRLQQRISEKPVGAEVFVLKVLALLLVTGHALQPSQRSDHAEQQVQLRMLQHMRLDEQCAAPGIEPGGQVVDDDLKRVLLDATRVGIIGGQRVPVRDEEEALVVVLQTNPVAQRPDIVAEMQFPVGRMPLSTRPFLFWEASESQTGIR